VAPPAEHGLVVCGRFTVADCDDLFNNSARLVRRLLTMSQHSVLVPTPAYNVAIQCFRATPAYNITTQCFRATPAYNITTHCFRATPAYNITTQCSRADTVLQRHYTVFSCYACIQHHNTVDVV